MPVYDAESMDVTARKIDTIAEDLGTAAQRLTGVEGANPFGDVERAADPGASGDGTGAARPGDDGATADADGAVAPGEDAAATLGAFTDGMRAEFDAATRRVSEAGTALRDAVRAMREADAVAADNLTMRER